MHIKLMVTPTSPLFIVSLECSLNINFSLCYCKELRVLCSAFSLRNAIRFAENVDETVIRNVC
jgi:hypothetical protein